MNDTDDIHDYIIFESPNAEYINSDCLSGGSFGIYRISKHRSHPGYSPCFAFGLRSLNDDCICLKLGYANLYFKPFKSRTSWVACEYGD